MFLKEIGPTPRWGGAIQPAQFFQPAQILASLPNPLLAGNTVRLGPSSSFSAILKNDPKWLENGPAPSSPPGPPTPGGGGSLQPAQFFF